MEGEAHESESQKKRKAFLNLFEFRLNEVYELVKHIESGRTVQANVTDEL